MNRTTYRRITDRNRDAHHYCIDSEVDRIIMENCDGKNIGGMFAALMQYFSGSVSREELSSEIEDPVARLAFLHGCNMIDEDDRMREMLGDDFDIMYRMLDEEERQEPSEFARNGAAGTR